VTVGRPAPVRSRRRFLVAVLAGAVLVVVAMQLIAFALDRSLSFLSREPQSALGVAWYAGAMANVGAVLWVVGATACGLAWLVERAKGRSATPLLVAAVLLVLLGTDDFFLLHEGLYGRLVPAEWVFGGYLILLVGYVVAFRDFLRPHDGLIALPLGIGLFVVSAVFDHYWYGHDVVEDGSKLLGIAVIVGSLTLIAFSYLRGPEASTSRAPAQGSPSAG
jgi:hypothetical protein